MQLSHTILPGRRCMHIQLRQKLALNNEVYMTNIQPLGQNP